MSTDTYTALVNQPLGRKVAAALGLPQPVELRRHRDGQPLLEGPALVLGRGPAALQAADQLLDWGVDVRRHAGAKDRFAAVVACFDEVATPADLSEIALELSLIHI